MKMELRHLKFVCPKLDVGNVCPACPKESGTDALFGLPRKKCSGISHREALHAEVFFASQTTVDEYVQSYTMERKEQKLQACSDFLAGDALRSSQRFHALFETAVFGCACKHEFPVLFLNLKHGERLGYGVWLIEELLSHSPETVKPCIMYDIACSLVTHLKKKDSQLLEKVMFALPSFHAYGHKPACQVLYSPLRVKGIGLSDGEVMERLWSYMRRFSRMTKEMHPAHRIDVLTHALLYYGIATKNKQAKLILQRWIKTCEMKSVASQQFSSIIDTIKVSVTDELIEEWIQNQVCTMSHGFQQTITADQWKTHYYLRLNSYYITRDDLVSGRHTERARTIHRGEVFNMENQLADFERRYKILYRWKVDDKEFVEQDKHS